MSLLEIDRSDRKEIGKTGEYVSAIGLGTWAIRDYRKCLEAYLYAIESGIDNIDTAEMYHNGRAEEFVGELLKRVGGQRVFITTKILPERLISREEVLKAARSSVKRLGVSTVDLMLIHWPNKSISISQQVRNFESVYLEGLARYIGVSNFSLTELEEAVTAVRKADIVVNQVHYSIIHRDVEEDLLPYAILKGITIQAYTPIERGSVKDLEALKQLSFKYNKTPIQIALNYLISRPRVIAIPKAESKKHIEELLGSMGWRLSLSDLMQLSKATY